MGMGALPRRHEGGVYGCGVLGHGAHSMGVGAKLGKLCHAVVKASARGHEICVALKPLGRQHCCFYQEARGLGQTWKRGHAQTAMLCN